MGEIEISYRSHVVVGSERRDDRQCIALYGDKASIFCREETKTRGKFAYTYTTEHLLLPDIAITSLVVNYGTKTRTSASLLNPSDTRMQFGPLAQSIAILRPSQIGNPSDFKRLPNAEHNGLECTIIHRVHDRGATHIKIDYYLAEQMEFLPVFCTLRARENGRQLLDADFRVSYEKIDNLNLPKTWVFTEKLHPNTQEEAIRRTSSLRTNIELKQAIPVERFQISLPVATELSDARKTPISKLELVESETYSLQRPLDSDRTTR